MKQCFKIISSTFINYHILNSHNVHNGVVEEKNIAFYRFFNFLQTFCVIFSCLQSVYKNMYQACLVIINQSFTMDSVYCTNQ